MVSGHCVLVPRVWLQKFSAQHMNYSEKTTKRGFYRGLDRGVFYGLPEGEILGVLEFSSSDGVSIYE